MKTINNDGIPELNLIRQYSYLMDEIFVLPGIKFRFGLDPLLGLVPWLGDLTGTLISGVMVLGMIRYGVSRKVLLLMTFNLFLEAFLGSIPILGDIFDFSFKANSRNLKLLNEHWVEGRHQVSGAGLIWVGIIGFILVIIVSIYLCWKSFQYLRKLFA